jgi:hypothetical protein
MLEIKIPIKLFENMTEDLLRPHEFAFERMGFLFCKSTTDRSILFPYEYLSIDDENYIPDELVGARVNSIPLRKILQEALTNQVCVIHVHIHNHRGKPFFSTTDLDFLSEIVPPLRGVCPHMHHGAIVLSKDNFSGKIYHPDCGWVLVQKIKIVGQKLINWG